jgi:hypothetical protein
MLTSVTIRNFKGIGERFTLPIRPLTLLFGPNSAGKSTIFQALHYARQVLNGGDLDARRISAAEPFIDLGGFRNFVHNRDVRRAVTLRLEFSPGTLGWYGSGIYDEDGQLFDISDVQDYAIGQAAKAAVEFAVRWHDAGPRLDYFSVELNGEVFGRVAGIYNDLSPAAVEVNGKHPIWSQLLEAIGLKVDADWSNTESDYAPFMQDYLSLRGGQKKVECWVSRGGVPMLDFKYYEGWRFGTSASMGAILFTWLIGPVKQLVSLLNEMLYLGPIRQTPPREHGLHDRSGPDRVPTGLSAWDLLHDAEQEFIDIANVWLSSKDRLDTGYIVRRGEVREIDPQSKTWKELLKGKAPKNPKRRAQELEGLRTRKWVTLTKAAGEGDVLPQDVGTGIAQVVPVVVASVISLAELVCIEQPELHLHPRAQCELGDLFIVGALGNFKDAQVAPQLPPTPTSETEEDGDEEEVKEINPRLVPQLVRPAYSMRERPRTMILETHSEHLVLRILRRIRETTRGQPHDAIAVKPEDVSICYVAQEHGEAVPRTIHVDEHGEFIEPWPDKFFEQDFYERFG